MRAQWSVGVSAYRHTGPRSAQCRHASGSSALLARSSSATCHLPPAACRWRRVMRRHAPPHIITIILHIPFRSRSISIRVRLMESPRNSISIMHHATANSQNRGGAVHNTAHNYPPPSPFPLPVRPPHMCTTTAGSVAFRRGYAISHQLLAVARPARTSCIRASAALRSHCSL